MRRYTMSAAAIAARVKGGKSATAHYVRREWVTAKVTKENRDWARAEFGCVNTALNHLRGVSRDNTKTKNTKGE